MSKIEWVTVWEDKTVWVRYSCRRTRIIKAGEKIPTTVFDKMDSCENPTNRVADCGMKYRTYK